MEDQYGSDYISITDDSGREYELEVLTRIEYNGCSYVAVIPADEDDPIQSLQVSILKSVDEEIGDPMLLPITDEKELKAVYDLIMDSLYEDEETDD